VDRARRSCQIRFCPIYALQEPVEAGKKKDNVVATDPSRGCNDTFGVKEADVYTNMTRAISGDVYLDLNGKVFYNENTAALRDALQQYVGRYPTCDELRNVMNTRPVDTVKYIACQPTARNRPNRWCQSTSTQRGLAASVHADWMIRQLGECQTALPQSAPGRYFGWQQLNVNIGTQSIIPIFWKAKIKLRDIDIVQGLKSDARDAPSQGVTIRGSVVESYLAAIENTIGPAFAAQGWGDIVNNPGAAIVFIVQAPQGVFDNGPRAVRINGVPLSQYLRAAVTYGCALSPWVQRVVDPNNVATRLAFDRSMRNLFDKLYNKGSNPNVPIGTDIVCNPPGAASGSGFCGNLYDAFSYVASLPPDRSRQCVIDNIKVLLTGGKPNFMSCV